MGLSEYYSVYVARGGDIIVILSPRVLGVWGTGRFCVKVGVFKIIFGLDRLESGGDGIFREKRIVLMECLDIDKMGAYSLRSIPPSVQGCALDVMINQSKNGRRKKFQNGIVHISVSMLNNNSNKVSFFSNLRQLTC